MGELFLPLVVFAATQRVLHALIPLKLRLGHEFPMAKFLKQHQLKTDCRATINGAMHPPMAGNRCRLGSILSKS